MKHVLFGLSVLLCSMLLAGCAGGYALQGKVVEGDFAGVFFVDGDDEQLDEPGLGGARIEIYRDPDRPNRSLAATGRSDSRGEIDMTLDAFGAGWMDEQWLIEVIKPGFETVQQMVHLPSAGKKRRMLIMLSPGVSIQPEPREDLWEEYERYR
jgi:hypothetical protein